MNYMELLPSWAKPVFEQAGLKLEFEELQMSCASCSIYSASVKCCTFFPNLSNFAAGIEIQKNSSIFDSLLQDENLSLPLGIFAPETYKQKYSEIQFGLSEELLCPHFDRKKLNCGIWSSRPSSCVRFVCKSSLGDSGQEVWERTEEALRALEANLSYEAALNYGLVNYEIHRQSWSVSAEDKKDFYLASARFVSSLSSSQIIDLAGEQFERAKTALRAKAMVLSS